MSLFLCGSLTWRNEKDLGWAVEQQSEHPMKTLENLDNPFPQQTVRRTSASEARIREESHAGSRGPRDPVLRSLTTT